MGKGFILILVLFGMLGGFASCRKETQLDLLMHTWKVDDWIVAPGMNLADSMKNEMIKSATMEFKEDSIFIFKGMNPKPTTGKYYLNMEAQLLTLIPEGSLDSYGHAVKVLTKHKLVLEDSSGNTLSCSH